jgi:hypothetical protein
VASGGRLAVWGHLMCTCSPPCREKERRSEYRRQEDFDHRRWMQEQLTPLTAKIQQLMDENADLRLQNALLRGERKGQKWDSLSKTQEEREGRTSTPRRASTLRSAWTWLTTVSRKPNSGTSAS